MPNLLPPLASAHRHRWQRVGELFARLPRSNDSRQTLPLRDLAAPGATGEGEAADLQKIPAPLGRPVAPLAISAIDLKRGRADSFFRALTWNRVGLQTVVPWPDLAEEAAEASAPLSTGHFFSSEVPWSGRQAAPGAALGDRQIGAGLDLKFLLTAATAQAVQTSRRSRGASTGRVPAEIDSAQASTFFRQLNWETRGTKA